MKGDTLKLNGICKVCSGDVPITLNNANTHVRYDSWRRANGTCVDCGTWFSAVDIIDRYDITGEASQVPKGDYTRDYRLERQPKTKDDRLGVGTGNSH